MSEEMAPYGKEEKKQNWYSSPGKEKNYSYSLKELNDLSTDELFGKIRDWGSDRGFFGEGGATVQGQYIKLIEEAGELAGNIARGKDVKDDIGDMSVVLTMIAILSKTDMKSCLAQAYFDIQDRKGQWVNGSFVKEKDLL